MKIVFLRTASEDVRWFAIYYGRVFPEGRKRANARYRAVLESLKQSPLIGHPIDDLPAREFSIPSTPFSIIYRVRDGRIEIMRLWDERRDRAQLAGNIDETS